MYILLSILFILIGFLIGYFFNKADGVFIINDVDNNIDVKWIIKLNINDNKLLDRKNIHLKIHRMSNEVV